MNPYELYKEVENTQQCLEKQINTILQFESEETDDEAILRKREESVN